MQPEKNAGATANELGSIWGRREVGKENRGEEG